MITDQRFRQLALSFQDTTEVPHFDRAAFRTPKRIFATMGKDGVNLMLDTETQAIAVKKHPRAFSVLQNAWGKKGATHVDLRAVSEAALVPILGIAYKRATVGMRSAATRRKLRESKTKA
ncbi:MAG TPA: MmcQ/YjbR family DNA-binding protein [Leptospiraceae bacterium]|jgi:hypothetical protein|nr:MmcQ/YjbR family DNA-binding protein [Leptospirales bacterium]HMU85521.1 MmcQ/YjbR family DNA-binding protein [Leptospiraceae bacterium]HMY45415.1 MmcQ/YjbR family DNA-binding protein [Leptospiraceae bacterium]HNE22197.1 MmcQ/YjbR family DNA-binding protein [Leptospiraceae bacterium]HNN60786.1 MmcQ/YjbR family DNA-binding protein [Leptospiraceae bacterium]